MATPVLAAINGHAVGVGLTYALQWDIRVVATDAKLGFVFTRRGLVPEANSLWMLSRAVGASRALELLLTGRTFSGAEALEIGLVSQALPAGEVLDATLALATDIAEHTSPASVALTKKLFYAQLASPDRVGGRADERARSTSCSPSRTRPRGSPPSSSAARRSGRCPSTSPCRWPQRRRPDDRPAGPAPGAAPGPACAALLQPAMGGAAGDPDPPWLTGPRREGQYGCPPIGQPHVLLGGSTLCQLLSSLAPPPSAVVPG